MDQPTSPVSCAVEVSIVMPCLNEADTLATCIEKAQQALREQKIQGEVIVADNGSTDGSQAIATRLGARLVPVAARGYGRALMGGIAAAQGRFIIMGDADDSYDFPHSTELCGEACPHSSEASRGEDLDIEEPVAGWDCSTLHFHATLAGMLSATLIRNKVIQVRKSREKRLLTATGMVQPFHGKELPLDGVMGLIQQGTGHGHLRVCEHRIPTCLLVLHPASHALAIGCPRRVGDVVDKMA
jgi:hypothetical protein